MLKRPLLPAACALGAALWLAAGCKPPPPPATSSPPPGASTLPSVSTGGQDVIDTKPIADAVDEAIQAHPSLFPKGTALKTVTVRDRVVALDFNSEFGKLGNLGDTVESKTQRELRAALAQFATVDKMTVTVQGKPYDSQTTDWTTPVPVRLSQEEKEAALRDGMNSDDRRDGQKAGSEAGESPGVGLPIRSAKE